jgi:transketolase
MKAAIRMASLSHLPAIYLFSHDSVAVGEDGPTHQPIEQLVMLRSIPKLNVIRPCDARETYAAWKLALESKDTPTALILSRQNLPIISSSDCLQVEKGAYIVSKEQSKIDYTIIATGSEVSLAVEVQEQLRSIGLDVRVVSMPCCELFEKQSDEYKNEVLGTQYDKIISLEALSTFGWAKWAKHNIGIDTFGTSAPLKDAFAKFGFTVEGILTKILNIIKKDKQF